jgi:Mn-containing catalase
MCMLDKRLQHTARACESSNLANLELEPFGGRQGERAAAMRCFTQASRRMIQGARTCSTASPRKG